MPPASLSGISSKASSRSVFISKSTPFLKGDFPVVVYFSTNKIENWRIMIRPSTTAGTMKKNSPSTPSSHCRISTQKVPELDDLGVHTGQPLRKNNARLQVSSGIWQKLPGLLYIHESAQSAAKHVAMTRKRLGATMIIKMTAINPSRYFFLARKMRR
jgi:hypothetical protein